MVFHKVAEIGTVGFYGRGAITLLFQQFQVSFRQCVFPLRFGVSDINPAVIDIGMWRIAVVEIRQSESGSRYVSRPVAKRLYSCVLGEQLVYFFITCIVYAYIFSIVPLFFI